MVKGVPLVRPLLSEESNRHNFSSKRNNRDDSFSSLLPAAAASGHRKTKQARGLRSASLGVGDTSFPMEMAFRPTTTPKSGACAIGRIAHLMTSKMTVMAACNIVAKEIYSEWISVAFDTGMWPKQVKAVAKQLEKVYLELQALRLRKTAKVPKCHQERAEKFNESMAGVFDIQTKDKTRVANLKASHNAKAVQRRDDENDRMRKELTRKEAAVQEAPPNELDQSGSASEIGGLDTEVEESDQEFCGAEADTNTPTSMAFPDVDVRSGTNSIDEKLGRAFIICNAKYRVSVEDLRGIFLTVANIVFG